MSSFVCSTRHLAALAAYAVHAGLTDDPVALCIKLRRLNNAAMCARYGEAPEQLQDLGRALAQEQSTPQRYGPGYFLSLATCLQYQCSEGDVMEAHPDRGALLELVEALEDATPAGPGRAIYKNVWAIG